MEYVSGMKNILIFDLDGTIDNQSLSHEKLKLVFDAMRKNFINGGLLYVVTARRLCDFQDQSQILKYNIPPKIIDLILYINSNIDHRWLYYNDDLDHPIISALQKLGKPKHNKIKHFERYCKDKDRHILNMSMGIQKMIQIEEIISMAPFGKKDDIYFFDDSSDNFLAYIYYITYINPSMKNVKFVGGFDRAVFM